MKKKSKKAAKPRPKQARQPPTRKSRKSQKVSPIPKGYHTVTPYLVIQGAAKAIDFYKRAFGAKELLRMPAPDGSVAHAEIQIGDSRVMVGDENPQQGARAPQTVGGTSVHIFMYLRDVDRVFAQASGAGATVDMPPMDMFWGDRYCKLTDPFGHKWNLATHKEDLSDKEMARRAEEAFKAQS